MALRKITIEMDPEEMGRKGGENSRKNMSPESATAIAKKAARARWGPKRTKKVKPDAKKEPPLFGRAKRKGRS